MRFSHELSRIAQKVPLDGTISCDRQGCKSHSFADLHSSLNFFGAKQPFLHAAVLEGGFKARAFTFSEPSSSASAPSSGALSAPIAVESDDERAQPSEQMVEPVQSADQAVFIDTRSPAEKTLCGVVFPEELTISQRLQLNHQVKSWRRLGDKNVFPVLKDGLVNCTKMLAGMINPSRFLNPETSKSLTAILKALGQENVRPTLINTGPECLKGSYLPAEVALLLACQKVPALAAVVVRVGADLLMGNPDRVADLARAMASTERTADGMSKLLNDARERADLAEDELAAARALVQEAQGQLQAVKAQGAGVESQLKQAEGELAIVVARHQDAERRVAELQQELSGARALVPAAGGAGSSRGAGSIRDAPTDVLVLQTRALTAEMERRALEEQRGVLEMVSSLEMVEAERDRRWIDINTAERALAEARTAAAAEERAAAEAREAASAAREAEWAARERVLQQETAKAKAETELLSAKNAEEQLKVQQRIANVTDTKQKVVAMMNEELGKAKERAAVERQRVTLAFQHMQQQLQQPQQQVQMLQRALYSQPAQPEVVVSKPGEYVRKVFPDENDAEARGEVDIVTVKLEDEQRAKRPRVE
eukprot:jgi/Mesvir1/16613/Mv10147-RA.1